jgi:hypothetical protein
MRTTLNLDDDVLKQAKDYAQRGSMPLGEAVSRLARRGLEAGLRTRRVHGLVVFDPPPDSPVVTYEHAKRLEDELE